MLSAYLGSYGLAVTARATATDGSQLLRHGRFDALVLDVMLPDLDGFEVCRRVRAESDITAFAMLLLSTYHTVDREMALQRDPGVRPPE
jgi:two-component system phosphate regulon response regulator OmpR